MIIPDQLSCDPHYPGYRADWYEIGTRLTFRLNGVEQAMVIAYDLAAGRVIRFEQDPDGKAVVKGCRVPIETAHGMLTVEPRAQA